MPYKKLFGTDGIRGRANQFPVTPDIALKVGQALALLLKEKYPQEEQHTVLIGKDTRLSGYMLEQALASGLNSMGVWVQLTGPLPTPGIGFLAHNMRVSAGVVISASHNPYYDNGIKIFFKDGFKISSKEEQQIEDWVFSKSFEEKTALLAKQPGRTRRIVDAAGRYIVFAKNSFPKEYSLKGVKIILDCANGAAYKVAPAIFRELGGQVIPLGDQPNGFNINEGTGALYPEKMAEKVLKEKAHIGISLDGDADRLILSDEKGRILNGDAILGVCALFLKSQHALNKGQVVITHLSNKGLEESLAPYGISFLRTEVGDRNVVKKMRESQADLGGESSGHIIFLKHSTTGDGCIASLNVLACMQESKKTLSELKDQIKEKPQISLSFPVSKKPDLNSIKDYQELMRGIKKELLGKGRVLVRYSGTEPLLRILAEGEPLELMQEQAQKVQACLKKHLSP